ncbi:EH signature domain-containing protein [Desulfofustis glycolicus]|uniref:EH_Signature domain-containing protein n=1 Tax=Desulfofustis glycolicus DSM 9705 TaxID=1121409 RepID=A0A1M5XQJ8_9BACT|nr:EH signature domain-containing protein [Desulfofustis glycolicus]SHI01798.1 EH_Signature domain-containing protein [Desulfofustis glycolicus DSM 9705]
MKISITKLNFVLPENPFGMLPQKLAIITNNIKEMARRAGTGNAKYKEAYSAVHYAILQNQDLSWVLDKPIKIRALTMLLESELKDRIHLTETVLRKINHLKPKPSYQLVLNIYQHYLSQYDMLPEPQSVAKWLLSAMEKKGMLKDYHQYIFGNNGPIWVADECKKFKRDFSKQLRVLDLQNYEAGRFLKIAKQIYFVEQLKTIPANKSHPILEELQDKSTFESRYDGQYLLGHKVLQILIERAPLTEIHESWLNVILGIGGDPRVPRTHPNYQKWWSVIDSGLNRKVLGWLSRLDLRLFLEALKNYSYKSGKEDLKRMFPSRKHFLEGLLDKQLITGTRLYLDSGAIHYLRQNYKKEHLPNYSQVDGQRSIIHVELKSTHLIEGSHSCYLWIYPRLHESALVFDYTKTQVTYSSLTQGLSDAMAVKGTPSSANITHFPVNFNWQHKAIEELQSIGININARDVLPPEDYHEYLRLYGRN